MQIGRRMKIRVKSTSIINHRFWDALNLPALQSQVWRLKSRQHKAKPAYAGFRSRVFSRPAAASLCVGADLSAVVNGLCNHPAASSNHFPTSCLS